MSENLVVENYRGREIRLSGGKFQAVLEGRMVKRASLDPLKRDIDKELDEREQVPVRLLHRRFFDDTLEEIEVVGLRRKKSRWGDDWFLLRRGEKGSVLELEFGEVYPYDQGVLQEIQAIKAEFVSAKAAYEQKRRAIYDRKRRRVLERLEPGKPNSHEQVEELLRAEGARYEALLRLLDERTPEAEAAAAHTKAKGDFEALSREFERDLSLGPLGPPLRLTSGVEVPSVDVTATWRALQVIATSGEDSEDSADLLHELLHAARDPWYRTKSPRLRQFGLVTHWGMRQSVREVVLACLYEIEHGQLVEYKLVPPLAPLAVPPEEL